MSNYISVFIHLLPQKNPILIPSSSTPPKRSTSKGANSSGRVLPVSNIHTMICTHEVLGKVAVLEGWLQPLEKTPPYHKGMVAIRSLPELLAVALHERGSQHCSVCGNAGNAVGLHSILSESGCESVGFALTSSCCRFKRAAWRCFCSASCFFADMAA